jgi:hypothetical protein
MLKQRSTATWPAVIACTVLLVFTFNTQVLAQQQNRSQQAKVAVNFNTRFASKHIWRGLDRFDDHGAVQPSINLDWFGTGFSTTVWSCWSLSSGSEKQEEIDYVVAYSNSFLTDTPYATNYSVNCIYYDYPHTNSRDSDAQEIGGSFSWPNLVTIGGRALVPSYYVGRLWPAKGGGLNRTAAGWIHILSLGYDLPVANLLAEGKDQVIHLSAEMAYNDGMGGAPIDHDWSHAVLRICTGIPVGDVTISPDLNYQISMDDSVNEENELWCGLSMSYRF